MPQPPIEKAIISNLEEIQYGAVPSDEPFHIEQAVPMSFPDFEPFDVGLPADDLPSVDELPDDATYDPLQNVLPSRKYPDPLALSTKPLNRLCTSRLVADPVVSELRAIGKMIIRMEKRKSLMPPATGSGWVAGPSLVMTAAHNVYEFSTGRWAESVVFRPAYDYYSPRKFPSCRVTACMIPAAYMDNPTTNNDIAACFVDRNIGDILDAAITMKPVPSNSFFESLPVTIVGYPAGSGFDFGKQMWQSKGDYLFGRSNGPQDAFSPVVATNFGAGASGCPWLVRDGNRLVAVGLTSGHSKIRYAKGEPNLMSLASPFFGHAMFDALKQHHKSHDFTRS